jgi:ornithine cyclodeaminase
VTARATVLCLLESLPDEHFNIRLLRYKDQAESFAERFRSYKNASFTIVDTHEELIVGADIILSCITSATDRIGCDEWFKEGVLLVPVHTRGFQNCDLFFDKVFGDLTGQISGFKYFDHFKSFNEFARVLDGTAEGRTDKRERILVYNIGMALHDIYIAHKIEALVDDEQVPHLELKEELPKFYI